MSDDLNVVRNGKILEVTMQRGKANAIDSSTSREMGRIFADFRDDPDLRVAIITGAGEKFFSGGWDLKAAAAGEEVEADFGVGGFAGISNLPNMNKPIIAAVNGYACGGGFELALAADMIVAADHAQVWLPEIFVGVVGDSACFRLTKRLPRAIAMEMLLTGRRMDAEEAYRWGLFNAVVPMDQLMDKAREYADMMIAAAPLSLAATKETTRLAENMSLEACYETQKAGGFPMYKKMLDSEDAIEGPLAFAEKREPNWKGR